jgi:cell wall-associated NlpC family hydrolase
LYPFKNMKMKKTRVFWQGFLLAVLTILSSPTASLAKALSKSSSRKGVKVAAPSSKKKKAASVVHHPKHWKRAAALAMTKKAQKNKFTAHPAPASIVLPDAPRNPLAAAPIMQPDSVAATFLTTSTQGVIGDETPAVQAQKHPLRERLVRYSMTLLGRPYIWASTGPRGFDCSGFTHYVFSKMGFELPRSSAEMPSAGKLVPARLIQKGDILVFTGTNSSVRQPGHVGIAINEPGQPVRFIHSSSAGGVKISDLDARYSRRFLMARRVL